MGKSSRRNRPSKAQRKKNAITARNAHYYNTVHCKSTNKVQRKFTEGENRTTTPTGDRSTVVPTYLPIDRQGRIRELSSKYENIMTNYIFT